MSARSLLGGQIAVREVRLGRAGWLLLLLAGLSLALLLRLGASLGKAARAMSRTRVEPGPGQESVWDYPRPPRLEQSSEHVTVTVDGEVLADTRRAYRVLETSHPPTYYIHPDDVRLDQLQKSDHRTFCEWKGSASYYDYPGRKHIAWYYQRPTPSFAPIKDHLCFYPSKVDSATVDGEKVKAQPGDFYGGWITSKVVGPFKGSAGTMMW